MLHGRFEVTVADQTAVLRQGDAYCFRSHQPHHIHNPGSEPCELVTACSPHSFWREYLKNSPVCTGQ